MKWIRLLLAVVYWIAIGQLFGQNTKPKALPDTCTGLTINVLKNDTDPNVKDRLRVTKFNNKAFIVNASVTKKDTGTFKIDSQGVFRCEFQPYFYGNVYLTYYVNDGWGSSATIQTGKITVIKNKDTTNYTLEPCPIEVRCVKTPDCVEDTVGIYCVRVRVACEWQNGCLSRDMENGFWHYYIRYSNGLQGGFIEITEDQALFITKNTCRH